MLNLLKQILNNNNNKMSNKKNKLSGEYIADRLELLLSELEAIRYDQKQFKKYPIKAAIEKIIELKKQFAELPDEYKKEPLEKINDILNKSLQQEDDLENLLKNLSLLQQEKTIEDFREIGFDVRDYVKNVGFNILTYLEKEFEQIYNSINRFTENGSVLKRNFNLEILSFYLENLKNSYFLKDAEQSLIGNLSLPVAINYDDKKISGFKQSLVEYLQNYVTKVKGANLFREKSLFVLSDLVDLLQDTNKEKIEEINLILSDKAKAFEDYALKLQDSFYKNAYELASQGNPDYENALNTFIKFSLMYKSVLDEHPFEKDGVVIDPLRKAYKEIRDLYEQNKDNKNLVNE